MKTCYKCGHYTEKWVDVPVVIKYFTRDDDDMGLHFDRWKLEIRPYCCFCTKFKAEEDIDSVDIEKEYEPEKY